VAVLQLKTLHGAFPLVPLIEFKVQGSWLSVRFLRLSLLHGGQDSLPLWTPCAYCVHSVLCMRRSHAYILGCCFLFEQRSALSWSHSTRSCVLLPVVVLLVLSSVTKTRFFSPLSLLFMFTPSMS